VLSWQNCKCLYASQQALFHTHSEVYSTPSCVWFCITMTALLGSGDYVPVGQFFHDRSVFVTGGTGFMGKVLVEKLLRSCPGIKNIYLLMRPKRGQDVTARLSMLLSAPVSFIYLRQWWAVFLCMWSSLQNSEYHPGCKPNMIEKYKYILLNKCQCMFLVNKNY
jgi:hypothetical protein